MLCFDVSANWREGIIRKANVVAGESDIRVLRIMGWHDTEGYASLHPRLRATRFARAFDLSGRAAVWFYHGFSRMLCGLVLPRIYTNNDHGFTQLRL